MDNFEIGLGIYIEDYIKKSTQTFPNGDWNITVDFDIERFEEDVEDALNLLRN